MTVTANYLGKKGYVARADRQLIEDVFGVERILRQSDLAASVVTGYQISISSGRCLVQGDTNTFQGLYRFFSDAAGSVTHSPDPTNPRWDTVVARVQDSDEVLSGADSATVEIQQGTPSSSASLTNPTGRPGNTTGGPTLLPSAMPLWHVFVPTTGGVSAAGLVDARPRAGGKSIINTSGTRTVNSFNFLSDANDVIPNLVVPDGALLEILVQAIWQQSAASAARAGLFLRNAAAYSSGSVIPSFSNELLLAFSDAPAPVASTDTGMGSAIAADHVLTTDGTSLLSLGQSPASTGHSTAGQVLGFHYSASGVNYSGGIRVFELPAGIYDLALLWKSSSGTLTAHHRRLWSWVMDPGGPLGMRA